MGRYLYVLVLSMLVTVFVGSTASAATIQEVLNKHLDPTTTSFVDYFAQYGLSVDGCWLTIPQGQIDPQTNLFKAGAKPTASSWQYSPNFGSGSGSGGSSTPNTNPSDLIFNTISTGPVGTDMVSSYQLGNNLGGAWSMEFSLLIFDPTFTGTEIDVGLMGEQDATPTVAVLTQDEVKAGTMLTFHVGGAAGEKVNVEVDAIGGESYAAGFFMSDPSFAAPEPATMSLLALGGLASVVLRRRK